ncbi:glycyl-radical enzyme activating protein, partial [Clostridium saudiense]|nr:glycyl-radical enzyme activating protein [Clostridium saudiense]
VDTVLMDIKHTSPEKHKRFTGRDNKVILENAKIIAELDSDLIIRVPVIPTFNHTKEEIRDIARFAKTLKGVTRLHLLPYHRMGQDKYTGLNRSYILDGINTLSSEHMDMLLEVVLNEGLKGQIGG